MNDVVFDFFGTNELWKKITDVGLVTVLALLAVFAGLGLYQLIKRKSLKKVDGELIGMIPSLVLVAVIYFVFEKVCVLNYRPVLVDGVAEPSFPSTHALIAVTVVGMIIMALPKYIKDRKVRTLIDAMLLALAFVVAFGRVASGMHWLTDVLAGVVFGVDLVLVYGWILRIIKEKRHE